MKQEALVHLLQPNVRKSVEIDQHFIGFLKAVKPFWHSRVGRQNKYYQGIKAFINKQKSNLFEFRNCQKTKKYYTKLCKEIAVFST